MPFVSGFLRVRKRGGRPDNTLPGVEGPVDPDYGVDEGGGGDIDNELPSPPPGIWPPLTPDHPWEGLKPDHPIELPPGAIWPPLPPDVTGKYLALVLIGGGGQGAMYRYVVIDADARPDNELPGGGRPSRPATPGGHPDQGLPQPPPAQPKR
jgi:hypothetical protein